MRPLGGSSQADLGVILRVSNIYIYIYMHMMYIYIYMIMIYIYIFIYCICIYIYITPMIDGGTPITMRKNHQPHTITEASSCMGWSGKRGAAVGVFQRVVARKDAAKDLCSQLWKRDAAWGHSEDRWGSIYQSINLSIHPCIYRSIDRSIYQSSYHLSIYQSINLAI